jgi:hypothetical protein
MKGMRRNSVLPPRSKQTTNNLVATLREEVKTIIEQN